LLNTKNLLVKITENWPAKVLSVALAIIIFVFHRMSELEDRVFSAPLRIEYSDSLVPANAYSRMVRVKIRGEANSISSILESDIDVYLDLSRYTGEGSYRVPVQVRKLGTALGVDPLEITVAPPEVILELDENESKHVPLTFNIEGSLEPGYELVSSSLIPAQVVVDGPRRLMEDLDELSTEVIDLGGRSDDVFITVRIVNPNPLLKIRGDGLVEFRGVVKNIPMIRSFEDIPILIDGLDGRFHGVTEIPSGSIRIRGNRSEMESYPTEELILRLDCSNIDAPGSYTLPVQAEIPGDFTLISSDPAELTIQVFRAGEASGVER
jgi:hypothetical protein